MKPLLAAAMLPFFVTSCKVLYAIGGGPLDDPAYPQAGQRAVEYSPGSTAAPQTKEARDDLKEYRQHVYDRGVKDGRADRAAGLSCSYGRHCIDFDEATEDTFVAGYEKGYASAP